MKRILFAAALAFAVSPVFVYSSVSASAPAVKHDKEHHHVEGAAADHDHDSAHHKKHDHKKHHPEHKKGSHGHDKDHNHVDANKDHAHNAKHHKAAPKTDKADKASAPAASAPK